MYCLTLTFEVWNWVTVTAHCIFVPSYIVIQTERPTDRQTDGSVVRIKKVRDRQTDGSVVRIKKVRDRQTNRQTDRQMGPW